MTIKPKESVMTIDRVLQYVDLQVELYAKETTDSHLGVTFGSWFVSKYPEGSSKLSSALRLNDFMHARRTSDARTYLIGFLMRGVRRPAPADFKLRHYQN